MKSILLLTFTTIFCFAQANNNYYLSFIEAAGISITDTTSGADCSQLVSDALLNIKITFGQKFNDIEAVLDAMVTFVNKMKYDVNPSCRDLTTDFEFFMSTCSDDADALKERAEDNLDGSYFTVGQDLAAASSSLIVGEDSEAGRLHGKILRVLLGLDGQNEEATTSGENSDDSLDNMYGDVYKAYINEISILNSSSDSSPEENNFDNDEISVGVSSLVPKFQQIKRSVTASRKLQQNLGYASSLEL